MTDQSSVPINPHDAESRTGKGQVKCPIASSTGDIEHPRLCCKGQFWRQQPSQQLREQGLHIVGQDDGDSMGEQGHLLPPGERGGWFHGETAILSCVCSSPSPSRARHTSRAASGSPTSPPSSSWLSPRRSILCGT